MGSESIGFGSVAMRARGLIVLKQNPTSWSKISRIKKK